ncbi:MAG: GNAT family N-acetyltransferase [Clostridia bacterium]
MIRTPEEKDIQNLYTYLQNPQVRAYSRIKPSSAQELWDCMQERSESSDSIIRVIVNERDEAVGYIAIWEYNRFAREGFLATIIGEEHWGKGYNERAKVSFLSHVFERELETVYLLVRQTNNRSIRAVGKLPYVSEVPQEEMIRLKNLYAAIRDDHLIYGIYRSTFAAATDDFLQRST